MSIVNWTPGVSTIPSHWATDVNQAAFFNKDYAVATGAANTYAVALPVTKTAYYDGMVVEFSTPNASTGAATINVDGLGAKSIINIGGVALAVGQITTDARHRCIYNAASGNFEIQTDSRFLPTQAQFDNSKKAATTEFVRNELLGLGGSAYNAIFGSSLAASGYQKLPSGLIIQWGAVGATTGGTAVTWPIAFTTACYAALITPVGGAAIACAFNSLSTTGASAISAAGSPGCTYFSLGK